MKKLLVVILGLMIAASAPADARTVKVVASFTVLADMAKQIGGAHVEVHSLVGPNGDPHVYEPTPADGQALAGADIVLVSGLGLEGWMDRLIRASGTRAPVVVASQGIVTRHMVDDGKEITDPHAWNSAANGVIYARNITDALANADPADAADIRASGARYMKQLQELDAWVRSEVKTMPLSKRKIITSHDAFGYMGAAYNIRFLAPEGFSTESEPSARDVAALIDQIRKEKIKVVYIENSNDPRLVQQLASATGARIGGKLYPEALSEPDGPAPTYTRMFRYNVETLLHGMQGH